MRECVSRVARPSAPRVHHRSGQATVDGSRSTRYVTVRVLSST